MSRKKSSSPAWDSNDDWRARSDMNTLKEAEQIKADKQRMAGAQKHAQSEMKAIARVAGASSSNKPQRGQRAATNGRLAKVRI